MSPRHNKAQLNAIILMIQKPGHVPTPCVPNQMPLLSYVQYTIINYNLLALRSYADLLNYMIYVQQYQKGPLNCYLKYLN
jgi:hypothetical protein